jgi:hypothetical protein
MSLVPLFSTYENQQDTIIGAINGATTLVYGLINLYQSEPIHNAILAAKARDLDVQFIFDRRQQFLANPRLDELVAAGIPVYLDKFERSIRSQYILINDRYVLGGNYLFSYPYNTIYASDSFMLTDVLTFPEYLDNWTFHMEHSEPYEPTGL